MVERYSVWLLPAVAHRAAFRATIAELSEAHGGPTFDPHVTVYAGEAPESPDPQRALDRISHRVRGFELAVAGVDGSQLWSRTLFVALQPDPVLDVMSQRAKAELGAASPYRLDPHLSLAYRENMPWSAKASFRRTYAPPAPRLRFDGLRLVAAGPEGWADVPAWRTVAEVELA